MTEEEIAAMITKAIATSSEENTKRTAQLLKETIGGLNLADQIKEAVAAAVPKVDDTKVVDVKKGKTEISPEIIKLQKQIETLVRTSGEDKQAAADATEKARTTQLIAAFDNAARKAGVSADRVKAIRSVLHSADARVKYTEDERPGLHFARDGYDEVLPLDAGLAEYLSSASLFSNSKP